MFSSCRCFSLIFAHDWHWKKCGKWNSIIHVLNLNSGRFWIYCTFCGNVSWNKALSLLWARTFWTHAWGQASLCTVGLSLRSTSAGDKDKTGVSVRIRRGSFIYNTWCWQGVSSSASILQGWSARLRMYCTVFGNQDCSGTRNTRLKQQTLSFFFLLPFPSFSYKMVQTTIQNICAVDILQKSLLTS